MLNIEYYEKLTEQELTAYIASITVPNIDVKIKDKAVYKDGVLWFYVEGDIREENLLEMARNDYLSMVCAEHFADRLKPDKPSEPIPSKPELSSAERERLDQDELLLDMYLLQLDVQLSLQAGGGTV